MIDTQTKQFVVDIFPTQGKATDRVERIKVNLRGIADTFILIGEDLAQAFRAKDWERLGIANFSLYCEQFNLSDSMAYDLVRIADMARSFPEYRARMLDAGVSNMRLILPQVGEDITADQVDTLTDMAATATWKELRKQLHQAEREEPTVHCPTCGQVWRK